MRVKKKTIKILALTLAIIFCAGMAFGCKYRDVAGDYRVTRIDGTNTLTLKASGKFTLKYVYKASAVPDKNYSGTFTVKDKTLTLTFNEKKGEPSMNLEPVDFEILANGNLKRGDATYTKL